MKYTYKVVFLRHGQSLWNKENLFTGWVDCGLSERGLADAKTTGKLLKEKKYFFDYAFTSVLKKAIKTLDVILEEMDLAWIPVEKDWRLNERHYGDLIGKNKSDILKEYGEEQFMKWRRGYDTPPPPIKKTNPYYQIQNDIRYHNIKVPKTECPKDVMKRVIPYWKKNIVPKVKAGKQVIVAAHGNSLRSLIKYFDNVPKEEMLNLNIPTGIPFVYEFDKNMKPIKHYYLGDPKKVAQAIEEVKNQGRKK